MIYGYSTIKESAKVVVYLRYCRNKPIIKYIKQFSKQGHRRMLNSRNIFKMTRRVNVGNTLFLSSSKVADLTSIHLFKYDKNAEYSNRVFGELISLVW
jgi:ribosomal protein S8